MDCFYYQCCNMLQKTLHIKSCVWFYCERNFGHSVYEGPIVCNLYLRRDAHWIHYTKWKKLSWVRLGTRSLILFTAFNRNLINKGILNRVTCGRSEEWGRGTDAFIKSAIDASTPQRPSQRNKIKDNFPRLSRLGLKCTVYVTSLYSRVFLFYPDLFSLHCSVPL